MVVGEITNMKFKLGEPPAIVDFVGNQRFGLTEATMTQLAELLTDLAEPVIEALTHGTAEAAAWTDLLKSRVDTNQIKGARIAMVTFAESLVPELQWVRTNGNRMHQAAKDLFGGIRAWRVRTRLVVPDDEEAERWAQQVRDAHPLDDDDEVAPSGLAMPAGSLALVVLQAAMGVAATASYPYMLHQLAQAGERAAWDAVIGSADEVALRAAYMAQLGNAALTSMEKAAEVRAIEDGPGEICYHPTCVDANVTRVEGMNGPHHLCKMHLDELNAYAAESGSALGEVWVDTSVDFRLLVDRTIDRWAKECKACIFCSAWCPSWEHERDWATCAGCQEVAEDVISEKSHGVVQDFDHLDKERLKKWVRAVADKPALGATARIADQLAACACCGKLPSASLSCSYGYGESVKPVFGDRQALCVNCRPAVETWMRRRKPGLLAVPGDKASQAREWQGTMAAARLLRHGGVGLAGWIPGEPYRANAVPKAQAAVKAPAPGVRFQDGGQVVLADDGKSFKKKLSKAQIAEVFRQRRLVSPLLQDKLWQERQLILEDANTARRDRKLLVQDDREHSVFLAFLRQTGEMGKTAPIYPELWGEELRLDRHTIERERMMELFCARRMLRQLSDEVRRQAKESGVALSKETEELLTLEKQTSKRLDWAQLSVHRLTSGETHEVGLRAARAVLQTAATVWGSSLTPTKSALKTLEEQSVAAAVAEQSAIRLRLQRFQGTPTKAGSTGGGGGSPAGKTKSRKRRERQRETAAKQKTQLAQLRLAIANSTSAQSPAPAPAPAKVAQQQVVRMNPIGGGGRPHRVCHYCGKADGHIAKDCPCKVKNGGAGKPAHMKKRQRNN